MFSYLLLLILPIQVVFGRIFMWMCESGLDCLEGYSCHDKICKKCLKCDMLFREGESCVTDFADCGDCLTGYEEVLMTDFSAAIKPCKPLKKGKLKKCTNDHNCPQNNYCSEESCMKCFDCSLINRLSPRKNCAKSLDECGSCLNGFYEVAVTTDSNFKPCENSVFVIPEMPDSYKMLFSNVAPICFLLVVFFGAVLVLVYKRFRGRILSKTTYQPPVYPSAPPLYTVDAPQSIRKLEATESSTVTLVKAEKQQAKIFKPPDALYYYAGEERNEFNDLPLRNDDDIASRSNSWTPTTTSNQSAEINCSAGILVHRYLQLSVNDLVDSPAQQLNVMNFMESIPPTVASVALNVSNDAEIAEVSTDERSGVLVQTEDSSSDET